jgi:hypothetical protein
MSAYEKSFLDLNGVNALWARIKALFVPNTRTVNGQALSSNVTIATPGTLKTNATNAQTASSGEAMSGTMIDYNKTEIKDSKIFEVVEYGK